MVVVVRLLLLLLPLPLLLLQLRLLAEISSARLNQGPPLGNLGRVLADLHG